MSPPLVCFLMTLHYFISFHLIFVSKIENNTESLTNFEKIYKTSPLTNLQKNKLFVSKNTEFLW